MLIYNQDVEYPILEPNISIPNLYEDKDIDTIFSNFITNELKNKSFDILFIPFGLSESYMEFLGLRLAHHIRLSAILEERRNVPIVLFGDLTPYQVNTITPLGEILFTEGIHYSTENKESLTQKLEQHNNGNLAKLTNKQKFIERIRIEPPANYGQSHHSIANEWAITRIAKAIGKENELRSSSAFQNAQNFLYYKYLNEKYPISAEGSFSLNLPLPNATSILYIDDEYEKGWKDLLSLMFSGISNLAFETLEENFKSLGEQQKIIDKAIEKIKSNPNYDIILLDLRLHDIDFEQTDITQMTGYKILKEIRKMDNGINKGISVIIFTASNKAWNYKTLMDIGADGYFIKESPENSIDENYTVENLKQFQTTLQNAVAKTTLLKPYWDLIAKIKKPSNLKIQNKGTMQIQERIKERLDMFFGLLKKGFERSEFDKSLFHYSDYELAFLTLWSVFNEVQAGYYNPSRTGGDWDWKLIDDTDIYYLRGNKTYLKYDGRNSPFYSIDTSATYNKDATDKIDYQIAFILLKHSKYAASTSKDKTQLKQLHESKLIRNKLYLTHGENTNSDFFDEKENDKRKKLNYKINPYNGGDIHKLFNLVAFVLTGDDTIKLS